MVPVNGSDTTYLPHFPPALFRFGAETLAETTATYLDNDGCVHVTPTRPYDLAPPASLQFPVEDALLELMKSLGLA